MKKVHERQIILTLFEKFISESSNGRRIQKNGRRISAGTLENYKSVLKYLVKLDNSNLHPLSINPKVILSTKEYLREKKYWLRFYRQFKDLMYKNGCTDNYVGMTFKIIRTFFRYLNSEKYLSQGAFGHLFYSPKSETSIIVLSQEQLKFLINDISFDESLPPHLKNSKDFFVVGCAVGLRYSDLVALKPYNLECRNGSKYIVNISHKTRIVTRIKIPQYVEEIIKKYQHKSALLKGLSLNAFNKNLKLIGEMAGWTYPVGKFITVQGKTKVMKTSKGVEYRFCDLLSSHVMRKTAITTMLLLGMPEPLVRMVSGHAPNSKEFYRYVRYSQSFMDTETDKVFNKISEKA